MSGIRPSSLLALPILLLGFMLSRSPAMMKSTPRMGASLWADGPVDLVATPQYEVNKTDIFANGATHMALLHNSVLRGYNSIYLQAPHVPKADKASFIGYALTWHRFAMSHHDDEEQNLFGSVEGILHDASVFDETLKEHEAFLSGLNEFHDYLMSLPTPAALSASKLLRIMDSFRDALAYHFHSEVRTIAALATHSAAPSAGTPDEAAAAATFKLWGKKTVMKAGLTDVVPFFLLNLDATAENGMWARWPPMPAPIRWGLVNLVGTVHADWWKFASCDAKGMPRELWALQFPVLEG